MIVAVLAAATLHALGASVQPGVWNTNFTDSLAYAKQHSVPIVVVWGNTSCSYCNKLSEVLEDDVIMDWAGEHPIMMVERHEAYQEDFEDYSADHKAAYEWINGLDDTSKLGGNPKVGVWWKRSDGTVECSSAFTGRMGKMPATTPKNDLAGQFANSLDLLVGDYGTVAHSDFAFGDTDTDHLEANGTKTTVAVPFVRESATKAMTEKLVVSYPSALGRADATFQIVWDAKAAQAVVDVPVYWQSSAVGQSATLSHYDANGSLVETSHIRYVSERTCSVSYPRFVGESFAYGEWTMDYSAAKSRAASDGGYVLALFTGTMWCPYCYGLDKVFSDARFKAWAVANKVSLVTFDQGLASSPSTPEGTLKARLLSYTAGTDHYVEGQDPYGAGVLRSGAYYMSGKGISSEAAASARALTTKYTEEFLSPESTSARCSNPTLVLVKGDKVVGRMATLRSGVDYNVDETIARLPDLLALNARDDEYDDYASTTTKVLKPDVNELTETELQISRRKAFYVFKGTTAGRYLFRADNAASDEPVLIELYEDGEEGSFASGEGEVSAKISASAMSKGVLVKISAYGNGSETVCTGGVSSRIKVRLSATLEAAGEVVPFKSLTKAELKEYNPELYQKQTATVPVYENVNLGGKRLVGTLAVSVTSANRISAKFTGEKTIAFSGTWDEIDTGSGAVMTTLEKTVARVAYALNLTMDAEGGFEAMLSAAGETLGSGTAAAGDISAYGGNYTVTLVDAENEAGTGYLTVKITTAGKATVKGVMPDGAAISVSAVLSPNADGTATLPVYKATNKGVLSIALAIDPDADETWGKEGETDVVRAVTGCFAVWEADDEIEFNVYGSYWQTATPLAVCELYKLSDELGVVIGGETNDVVTATKSGFKVTKEVVTSLSFTKSTGVFSGKAKIAPEVGGKAVTATIKGVLLPGWIACGACGEEGVERPYGSGTLYYKVGKETVSLPIDLIAESAE